MAVWTVTGNWRRGGRIFWGGAGGSRVALVVVYDVDDIRWYIPQLHDPLFTASIVTDIDSSSDSNL
jgi:hypothetical protein